MKKIILLILIILLSPFSLSDSINFGVWTDHSVSGEFNEDNNLFAIEINGYVAGRFINSYLDETYIFAKKKPIIRDNIGIMAGLSYGYQIDCFFEYCPSVGGYDKQLLPYGSLYAQVKIWNLQVTLIEAYFYRNVSIGFLL